MKGNRFGSISFEDVPVSSDDIMYAFASFVQ
jgi:hypothetical protein